MKGGMILQWKETVPNIYEFINVPAIPLVLACILIAFLASSKDHTAT